MTSGHLWKLGTIIVIARFSRQLPWVEFTGGNLTLHQRQRLTQLAGILRYLCHTLLAREIEAYLYRSSLNSSDKQSWVTTFPQGYMRMMAVELVAAIDKGEALQLGSMWDNRSVVRAYTAIFIQAANKHDNKGVEYEGPDDIDNQDNANDESDLEKMRQLFVFTASRPKDSVFTDIDRHVSLEVECKDLTSRSMAMFPDCTSSVGFLVCVFFGNAQGWRLSFYGLRLWRPLLLSLRKRVSTGFQKNENIFIRSTYGTEYKGQSLVKMGD